jgi:uncharacterized RDD family membrane protein YckC
MEQRPDEAEFTPETELTLEDRRSSTVLTSGKAALEAALPQAAAPFDTAYPRAGFWLRFIALTIDTVILGVFALVLLLLGLLATSLGDGLEGFTKASDERMLFVPLWISGVLTGSAAYFTILHSEYGQTIGKSLLGLEVRTRDGDFLSYSQALFRWLAYGMSAFPCGLGFLWVGLNPGKRGWHDLLAGTIVVTLEHQEL